MDFEQALRAELISLSNLNNKVFPIFAPEQTPTPFVIYSKQSVDLLGTMDGMSKTRIGRYEIDLVTQTYESLQALINSVKNKLLTFQGRKIGTNGPFVQAVLVDNVTELYVTEPKLVHANMEVRFYFEGE